jgi:hypothetical protein
MATFPSLAPSAAPITPGAWPVLAFSSLNGAESRIRQGSAQVGRRLQLTFSNITEASFLAILAHYQGQRSGFDPFGFDATTLAADLTPSGHAWLYASRPQVVDEHLDVFTVVCEFKSEPRGLVVAAGDCWRTGATTLTVGAIADSRGVAAGKQWATTSTALNPGARSTGIGSNGVAWATSASTLTTGTRLGAWTPAALDPLLWLDFADSTTLTASGGVILQIIDKSGNGRHASQAASSNRPTVGTVNGKSCMVSTSAQYLELQNTISTVRSFAAVAQFTTTTGLQFIVGDSSSFDFHGDNGSNLLSPSFASSLVTGGSGWTNGASTAPSSIVKSASTSVYIFNTTGSVRIGQFSADRSNQYGNRGIIGNTCEIIALASTIANLDREKFEGYLAHKWGFAGSLPASHPYKSAPP